MNTAQEPKSTVQIRRYNWTRGFNKTSVGTLFAPAQNRSVRTSAAELFYGQAMHASRDLLGLVTSETPNVQELPWPQRRKDQVAMRNLRAANTTTTRTAPASSTPKPPTPVSGVVAAPRVGIGVRVLVA